ncbi:band 4.1-like protein 3 [Sinocyclocheilus grahami]|uniref:band 4.1-like protein 3 n=1 Tax=Sinocyclocheilus grahami TaxID=75366 RepID=UPI0007AD01E5|nr:PREDICTED: band 4.1-like protein 3 [Sinocyclocheilus grahami]
MAWLPTFSLCILDDREHKRSPKRAKGQVLFDKVCDHLNLLEKDYFGMTYRDAENQMNWLDTSKEMKKQIITGPWNLAFSVKFYPPDPSQLSEDITRSAWVIVSVGKLEQFESTIGFKLSNHKAAKRLWKVCVEHHTFFRLVSPEAPPKRFLSLGSKFRYSGRTQAQTRRASAQIARAAPQFQRRHTVTASMDSMTVSYDDEKNAKPAVATDDFIAIETPEKKAEEMNSVEEEYKANSDESEQAPPPSVTKSCLYSSDPLGSELSLPSSPVSSTKVRRRRRESSRKRAASVSPAKTTAGCRRRQAQADRKAALLEEQALLLSARKQRLSQSRGGTLFSFSLHLPDLPSLLDEDGYLSFPDLTELRFLPESLHHFMPIKSPSLIPCFLFIFFFLLSTSFSVPYALTLSFPLALCLCYLEPKAASLSSSLAQGFQDSSDDETDSDQTDFNCDDDTSATESDFEDNFDLRTQMSEEVKAEPEDVPVKPDHLADGVEQSEEAVQDVPVVHTETKTITYESSEVDADGDSDAGVFMSAQTITSENNSSSTTTHITKTVKDGISETRIEKRIVITGDADMDHDQALAQAIKEAKEQHPEMSVTKVVVHKETEISAADGDA